MQTKNMIQTTANVVKVTNLKKGDAVKILEKEYSDSFKTIYAIVIDMYNTGENTFIELLQYEKSYDDVKATYKIYDGSKDLTIFPASPDEVRDYLESTVNKMEQELENKKKGIFNSEVAIKKVREFTNGELAKKITAAEFKEITQCDYNKQKQELIG